ncbi:MAG: glucose 1-dehydrogenase [Sphingomonadales bacterium]|nr:glucose 1-dehydrogenase [Sphingomonadales bacterium]
MRFVGKTVIITGGGQNLGQHYAERFAGEGAHVVVSDVVDTAETVAKVEAAGGRAVGVTADVTKMADCAATAEAAMEAFGRIDAVINNAALYGALTFGPFDTIDDAEWDAAMAVNVKGIWQMCKAAVPHMGEQGGAIVNIASLAATYGMPNGLHYTASKAAVIGLTRGLAREVARHNIRVNAVAPSIVLTEGTDAFFGDRADKAKASVAGTQAIRRSLEPEDVSATVLHLASDEASLITGQTVMIDGGTVML